MKRHTQIASILPSTVVGVDVYDCLRCGHIWIRRPGHTMRPRACPECHSTLWNTPRTNTPGQGRHATPSPTRTPKPLVVVRRRASETRIVNLTRRLLRVRSRLRPPTNLHLAALFGVHRNAVSLWIRGMNDMTEAKYTILRELERRVGLAE